MEGNKTDVMANDGSSSEKSGSSVTLNAELLDNLFAKFERTMESKMVEWAAQILVRTKEMNDELERRLLHKLLTHDPSEDSGTGSYYIDQIRVGASPHQDAEGLGDTLTSGRTGEIDDEHL
jgi:hypothetical protein